MINNRVLFIDDEPNVLHSFKRQLRGTFELVTARGPETALEIVGKEDEFAVVVTDMQMPGMSGAELLNKLKQNTPRTVRIMLTGNVDQDTATKAINKGEVFRFLTKPCSTEDLSEAISAGLKRYERSVAERLLLDNSLSGSVSLLEELLHLFGGTNSEADSKVQKLLSEISNKLGELEAIQKFAGTGRAKADESAALKSSGNPPLELKISELQKDQVLFSDIHTHSGLLLVRSGTSLSEALITKIRNYAKTIGINEPISVNSAAVGG